MLSEVCYRLLALERVVPLMHAATGGARFDLLEISSQHSPYVDLLAGVRFIYSRVIPIVNDILQSEVLT